MTFNNQDGTRGFYFDHQPVLGVGAVRRSRDALVDPLGEKKAPTELITTNTNRIPVALRPAVSAEAPLAAQYGMFDVLGIDRCGVWPKIIGTVLSRPIKCQLSLALAILFVRV